MPKKTTHSTKKPSKSAEAKATHATSPVSKTPSSMLKTVDRGLNVAIVVLSICSLVLGGLILKELAIKKQIGPWAKKAENKTTATNQPTSSTAPAASAQPSASVQPSALTDEEVNKLSEAERLTKVKELTKGDSDGKKNNWNLIMSVAKDVNRVELTNCTNTPYVVLLNQDEPFTIVNNDNQDRVIAASSKHSVTVKANSSLETKADFGFGPGIYSFSCGEKAEAGGLFYVLQNP